MNRIALLSVCFLVALSACANGIESVSPSPLKVDLNDVVTTGVVKPVDGITAAGQPDEEALAVFAKNGYAAVVDLRTAREDRGLDEKSVVESLGMEYVSLPVGPDGITFENAKSLDELVKQYEGPVLVHCRSSNRVGALLALRSSLDGASDEAAVKIGRQGGLTTLEPKVREALGSD